MFLKKLYLVFVILIIIFSISPAFAFGVLVRGPRSVSGAAGKLAYTDYVIADHRDGLQKMIVNACQEDMFYVSKARESYSAGIDMARKELYSSRYQQFAQELLSVSIGFISDATDEIFYYVLPITCSSKEVKASLIDPAYGIDNLFNIFDSSTSPFYYPANFLIPQVWQLAPNLLFPSTAFISTLPYLYHPASLTDDMKHALKISRNLLCRHDLEVEESSYRPRYYNDPETVINVFECRDASEFRQKLLAYEKIRAIPRTGDSIRRCSRLTANPAIVLSR